MREIDGFVERRRQWSYGGLPRTPFSSIFPEAEHLEKLSITNPYKRVLDNSIDFDELCYLCSIEIITGVKRVLEIGTFDGNTTLNLACNIQSGGKVVTVDLPEDWGGYHHIDVPWEYFNVNDLAQIGEQFKGSIYENSILQVRADSAKLTPEMLPYSPFDLIFIDGCHSREYVHSDTELALKVLGQNGVVVWHDYGMFQELSEYIDEFAASHQVFVIEGTRLALWQRDVESY